MAEVGVFFGVANSLAGEYPELRQICYISTALFLVSPYSLNFPKDARKGVCVCALARLGRLGLAVKEGFHFLVKDETKKNGSLRPYIPLSVRETISFDV